MISLTTLRAQIQARIDAVNGATPLNDLLLLRKSCESLGINQAVIDAQIQSRVNAVNGSTPVLDLVKLSKLSIRGDKRIGEIIKSPIKADTLDDGALIRMAGNVVLRSAFPALSAVYQNQVQFGALEDLGAVASGLAVTGEFLDSAYANGVLMGVTTTGILRTTDGVNWTKINRAGRCLCWDSFNNRWWLGTDGGLIYFSIDNGLTWGLSSAKAGVANESIVGIKADGLGNIVCIWQNTSAATTGMYYTSNNGSSWIAVTGMNSSTIYYVQLEYSALAKRWFLLSNTTSNNTAVIRESTNITSWSGTAVMGGSTGHSAWGMGLVDDWVIGFRHQIYSAFRMNVYEPEAIANRMAFIGWELKDARGLVKLDNGQILVESSTGLYAINSLSDNTPVLVAQYTSAYSYSSVNSLSRKIIDTPFGVFRFGRINSGAALSFKMSKYAYNTATEMYLPDFGVDENLNYSYVVAK